MELKEPIPWSDFLKEWVTPDVPAFAAHPQGKELRDLLPDPFPERLVLIVGPEGGFTDEEVCEATEAGAIAVGLGPNILRIETAALALAAFAAIERTGG
jgi:16S rRNA (uracil1498-N3)-methyltransferase